jgi:hypothetical protein
MEKDGTPHPCQYVVMNFFGNYNWIEKDGFHFRANEDNKRFNTAYFFGRRLNSLANPKSSILSLIPIFE